MSQAISPKAAANRLFMQLLQLKPPREQQARLLSYPHQWPAWHLHIAWFRPDLSLLSWNLSLLQFRVISCGLDHLSGALGSSHGQQISRLAQAIRLPIQISALLQGWQERKGGSQAPEAMKRCKNMSLSDRIP